MASQRRITAKWIIGYGLLLGMLAGCSLGVPQATPTLAPTDTPVPTETAVAALAINQPIPADACGLVILPPAEPERDPAWQQPIYASADQTAEVLGTLTLGHWIQVTRRVDDWYQVSLPGSPVNVGWIPFEHESLFVTQPCACTAESCVTSD